MGQCPKKARISPISMDTPPNGNLKIQHIIRALFEHVILFLKAVKSPIYNFFLGYYLPSSLNCYFRLVKRYYYNLSYLRITSFFNTGKMAKFWFIRPSQFFIYTQQQWIVFFDIHPISKSTIKRIVKVRYRLIKR